MILKQWRGKRFEGLEFCVGNELSRVHQDTTRHGDTGVYKDGEKEAQLSDVSQGTIMETFSNEYCVASAKAVRMLR